MTDETPTRRRRPSVPALVVGGVLGAALVGGLVAIPLGGWDTVELGSARIPVLASGERYEGRHYSIELGDLWVGSTTPDDYEEPDEGMTFVFLEADVRNEWIDTDSDVGELVTFAALEELETFERRATIRIVADGEFSSSMPPGVDTRVLMRWEVPADSIAAGDDVLLGVIDGRPDDAVLFYGTIWRDERVAAQATLRARPSSELDYSWADR